MMGKDLSSLATPAFVVDLDVMERNCKRQLDIAQKLNVQLRPHIKTHKTVQGAILQTGGTKRYHYCAI